MDSAQRRKLFTYAKDMRRDMTETEKRLWFGFLREYPIHFGNQIVKGPYIVDFYCKKARLSIELDGSQHYEEKQLAYDQARTTYLEILEIEELRFPNSEVWENFEGVCETIHRNVRKRLNSVSEIPLSLLTNKH